MMFGRRADASLDMVIINVSRCLVAVLTVGFALAALTGTVPSLQTQLLVYLVGMVALNLPHGGYEHFENLRYRGLPFGTQYVVGYLALVGTFVGLFFIAPVLALALAFGTAIAKGGHGDLRVMDAYTGSEHLRTRPQRALAALVRGGAVMIVPFVFWTDTYLAFSTLMIALFDPVATLPASMSAGSAPLLVGTGYALAVVAHLGGGFLTAGPTRAWLLDAAETLLLVAYFVFVPVVVAIGLYFPLWYSLRQSARNVTVREMTDESAARLPAGVAWAALTVGALVTALLAVALWVVVPNPPTSLASLSGLVAFYTVFVCIIALPHVVVGEWLDIDRGIWYVP